MKKMIVTSLGFVAGLGAGILIHYGYGVLMTRPGAPGGEILIPALILLLVVFGFALGRMSSEVEREWNQMDDEGQHDHL